MKVIIPSKTKFLVTIIISLLIISSAYTFVIPSVHAAELTTEQKGLGALGNVMGLDLSKYSVESQQNNLSPPSLGGKLQEGILYTLTSADSKLSIFYTYTNGSLQSLYVLGNEGNPILTKPLSSVDNIESAKDFLANYQANTNKSIFGELKNTLNNLNDKQNLTKTIGNTVLESTSNDNGVNSFKWFYTANGAIAPYTKTIAMSFKNGFLQSFIDNWDLYPVGSTNINLSKEQAIAIALDAARQHNWTMTLDEGVLDPAIFNEKRSVSWTTLAFDTSIDINTARSKDSIELYPVWKIGIVLNRVYGELYGIEVDIWADTKEIRLVEEQYSQLAGPWLESIDTSSNIDNVTQSNLTGVPAVIAISLGASSFFIIGIFLKKHSITIQPSDRRFRKIFGITLCLSMLIIIFLPLVQSASATNAGIIWGAQSSGASNSPVSYSWRKTDAEISRQWYVTGYLGSNFFTPNNGYYGYSNEGVNKDVILSQATTLNNSYDHIAVLDWDHGVGGYPGRAPPYTVPWDEQHYMFEDDYGTVYGAFPGQTDWSHGVYDIDIYNRISAAKAHFVFIDACQSANLYRLGEGYTASGNPLGLPFAFTHRIVTFNPTGTQMSADGYNFPDSFPQCYIGFPDGSAALDQQIDYDGRYWTGPRWYTWIIFFYYFALEYDISVNDALRLGVLSKLAMQ